MKTSIKTKLALVVVLAGLAFSCKKNEPVPADTAYEVDSTETTIDSVQTPIDTTTTTVDTTVTTPPAK
jgi:hypothetical protein